MINIKDTKEMQSEIDEVMKNLVEIRDKSIKMEVENLFIDMEKLLNVLTKNSKNNI